MCNKATKQESWYLPNAPDYFKTHDMCNKTVEEDQFTWNFVSYSLIPKVYVIEEFRPHGPN